MYEIAHTHERSDVKHQQFQIDTDDPKLIEITETMIFAIISI